jgi:hypothetical protein
MPFFFLPNKKNRFFPVCLNLLAKKSLTVSVFCFVVVLFSNSFCKIFHFYIKSLISLFLFLDGRKQGESKLSINYKNIKTKINLMIFEKEKHEVLLLINSFFS